MAELEIIEKGIVNLQETAGIRAHFEPLEGKNMEGFLNVNIDNQHINLKIQVKKEWRNQHLQQVAGLDTDNTLQILIGPRFNPKFKAALRAIPIAYLEANGNFFLKTRDIMVWLDGNKPLALEEKRNGRAFTKTGLRLVFQFLLDEYLINQPYRNLHLLTGTGIGNITNILRDLKQEGFLFRRNNDHYRLTQKKQLLEKWIAGYETRLKTTLKIGRFRMLEQPAIHNWKQLRIDTHKTCWGGEPAGALLTNYLKPAELTLYTTETRNELIRNYQLIPDENGPVLVYQKFWTTGNEGNTAPPLLVYADLMNTGDKRCMETAQLIFNEFLQREFQ